jgi:enoyl-CoA hydratase
MSEIIDKSHGHLAHIRLNRADHGNRFTMEMFRRFGEILTDVDADPDLRRTLVTANCAHFSVGVAPPDVLPASAVGKSPFDDTQVRPTGVTGPKRKKPLVNAVNGNCFNVGLELALASAICVASDNARFAFHEVRFGVYPLRKRTVSVHSPSRLECGDALFVDGRGIRSCRGAHHERGGLSVACERD